MLIFTLKTQKGCQPILRSGVVTANFEHSKFLLFFVSNLEHVLACWKWFDP